MLGADLCDGPLRVRPCMHANAPTHGTALAVAALNALFLRCHPEVSQHVSVPQRALTSRPQTSDNNTLFLFLVPPPTEGLPAKDGSAAPGGGTSGAAVSPTAPLIGRLGVRLQYPSLSCLLMSYLTAADPESMYELELEEAEERRMRQDCRKAAER